MAAVVGRSVLLLALATPAVAQEPALHVAFAAQAGSSGPPALHWLRVELLPRLAAWPAGLDATRAFRLDGPLRSPHAAPADIELPPEVCCSGEFVIVDCVVLFSCRADGTEDWWIDGAARLPAPIASLLRRIRCGADGMPRSLDAAALVGNVLPPVADGDPWGSLLQAGAANCGPVELRCWREQGHWRVRGRSDGGLALPALLLWLAMSVEGQAGHTGSGAAAEADDWRLRTFVARDGDRAEAARQLLRAERDGAPALRALLHADQDSRIAALDGLASFGSAVDLPAIVAAADPSMPWVERLVVEAVRTLWPLAGPEVREATRRRIRCSDSALVRAIDLESPAGVARNGPDSAGRWRLPGVLFVLFCGLLGLWWREQRRLQVAAAA